MTSVTSPVKGNVHFFIKFNVAGFFIDDPSYQLRLGWGLSSPTERALGAHSTTCSCHSWHHCSSNYVHQNESSCHVLWAGPFYSPCSEHHLHPCLASHCFYSDRAFVPSVICSSPVVLFPFSTSSCHPKMCGLTRIALLSGCSQLFLLLPLQIAYSHWRCIAKGIFQ